MKRIETDPVVAEFSARVRHVLGEQLRNVYWFGSRARGEGREDSDYDILIETATPITAQQRDRIADISVDISGERHVVFDVHFRDSQRMNRERSVWTPFLDAVVEEGVLV